MPVYFYNFRIPQGSLVVDELGDQLPNDKAAVEEAAMAAAELMRSDLNFVTGGAFEIRDESGRHVEHVPLCKS